MKLKYIILICVTILCANIAIAQTFTNNSDYHFESVNTCYMVSHTHVYAVGSENITPMAQTCDQQESNNARGINARRNSGDDPFGGGSLDQEGNDNPLEPGTPVGDIPWAMILLLAAAFALHKRCKELG